MKNKFQMKCRQQIGGKKSMSLAIDAGMQNASNTLFDIK